MIALFAAALLCVPAVVPNLDVRLVRSVITHESHYDPNITSPVGAMGMMQLMPGTARELGVCHPYNVIENIAAGTTYLGDLLKHYHGDVRLAVAAYNAGPGAVDHYGDVPPFAQTQEYVRRVLGTYAQSGGKVPPAPTRSASPARPAAPTPKPMPTAPQNLQRTGDWGNP